MSKIPFIDILERSHNGPICKQKDWDVRIIPARCQEKVKEYDIRFDPDNLVPSDNSLANDVYKAGFELALETGILCITTERIIKIDESELKESIREAPSEASIGAGFEKRVFKPRSMESKLQPLALVGPMGVDLSEEFYIPIVQSAAQYGIIDHVINPQISVMFGREVRTGSSIELVAGRYQAEMIKEAIRRAGRTGLSFTFGGMSLPGFCGKALGARPTDAAAVGVIAELKIDETTLSKIAYVLESGHFLKVLAHPIIGGYAGGPEGAAIMNVAHRLLEIPIYQCHIGNNDVFDVRYFGNTGKEAVWANSVATQAIDSNTTALNNGIAEPSSGLSTPESLYEIAVAMISYVASGIESVTGIRPAHGKYRNQVSGLESKFGAEVAKQSSGLKRQDANEIVKKLMLRYEEKLSNPPKGKEFKECFDLKRLKPSAEYLNVYKTVWKELAELGIEGY